ncbi:hypothetical protein EVJ30_14590 [Exiguobacterium sp. SH5S13]|uniref:hypothetical protein n=1 Tax=unclassified Exiguobacterium TaxID=2644629 RepID=UPI00103B9A04|nr:MULTISPECIES: hypothetical protein [unclassified Exiguobacterium]TCI24045.1 hypothetical protein EVJ32_15655 [Exiguobacterium sp. SH5S4]TCI49574.1 hypothetical protein EVJ30_14590 [Exiguobacterium sp. SH5S13]
MGKIRYYQAYLSIAAEGPLYSEGIERHITGIRQRAFSKLDFTTADVNFFEEYWTRNWYASGKEKWHKRLDNPTMIEVRNAIFEIGSWFAKYTKEDDWDGGGITIAFAGHGEDRNGSLVLKDGVITYRDLYELLSLVSWSGNLRYNLLLDSCYSGRFLIDFLYESLEEKSKLVPSYLAAACMYDETALEESSLGHGLFTYCFSVDRHEMGGYAAKAIQADNSYGPSLDFIQGAYGVSLLTFGMQNAIKFDQYDFEVCGETVPLFKDKDYEDVINKDEVMYNLESVRDQFKGAINRISKNNRVYRTRHLTTEELQQSLEEQIALQERFKDR